VTGPGTRKATSEPARDQPKRALRIYAFQSRIFVFGPKTLDALVLSSRGRDSQACWRFAPASPMIVTLSSPRFRSAVETKSSQGLGSGVGVLGLTWSFHSTLEILKSGFRFRGGGSRADLVLPFHPQASTSHQKKTSALFDDCVCKQRNRNSALSV